MKTQRPFRAAIWPLAVGSLLAVGFALANPEARQPSPLAHHLKQTEHLVAFRTVDDEQPTVVNSTPPAAPTIGLQPQPSIKSATRPSVTPKHSQPDRKLTQNSSQTNRLAPSTKIIPRATQVEITSADDTLTTGRSARSPAIFIESSHSGNPRTQSTAASQRKPMVSLGPVMESPENADSELSTEQPAQVKRHTKGVARRSANSASPRREVPTATATEIADNDNRDRKENNEIALLTAALAGRMDSSRLETHLVNLQRQVDQLTQKQGQDQSQSLQRTVQLLEKLEQTSQLQELQRRLDHLQNALPKTPTMATPAMASSEGTHPKESDEKPTEKSSPAPVPNPGPILKAEPKEGDIERLNLTIQDAEITEVLKMLGEISQVNILVGKGVKGKVSANLQEVTVEQALVGILRSLDCVFEREGRFIFVMTTAEADARKKAGRKLVTKVYRPNYISVADLQALVTPLLTAPVGKVAVTLPAEIGIAPDNKTAGGNRIAQQDALLVMDYPEVIQEIDNVLLEMDVPPLQVVIEAMILSVSLDDAMEFGVNFALLSDQNKDLFLSGNGRTLNGGSRFPGSGASIVPPGAQFLADTAGLKYGFLRGDMSMFINALEKIADTNVIASPKLSVLNKQKAELIIGEKLSYTTTTFNQTQTIQNVQFLDVGTKLVLRPFVAPDGIVRMEIHPERSSGAINPETHLPDLQTTEVTTNVMVRDGSTVVIGGLIEQKTEESQQRIPYLGAIPLVGNIFKNKAEKQTRNELMVLITPRIVREPEDAAEGDAVRFENEERANHFRDKLSPINRRNLTRMEYERALDLYEQGDLVRARTHIERALQFSKNDLDSLRLRDQIEEALHSNTRRILSFGTADESAEPLPLPPPAEGDESSIGGTSETATPFREIESSESTAGAESSAKPGELEAIFDLPPSPRRASKTVPKVD